MSLAVVSDTRPADRSVLFVAVAIGVIACAALLAGLSPIWFSIGTVFLFAGPHNWFEARYMLSRMPARWRPFGGYFSLGISGVLLLTAAIAALPWMTRGFGWSADIWLAYIAIWNTALISWIATLAFVRSHQRPRRNWPLLIPGALLLIGLTWLFPLTFLLALVYAHPLIALWFFDREIGRRKPAWRTTYRRCLLLVPAAMCLLILTMWSRPNLTGDGLTEQITRHAGSTILTGVSNQLLVALHTFLEMLHYGVWIFAMPLLVTKAAPWQVENTPLGAKGVSWQLSILSVVAAGVLVMLILWGGFLFDYPATRNIYFTVAMLHVLAEVPFLLRLL